METIALQTTWEWLDAHERGVLLDINPKAEAIINQQIAVGDMTEEQFFPFTPVGTTAQKQGNGKPWLPEKHVVTNDNTSRTVEIHHPLDSSFSKQESRRGILAKVRRKYTLNFDKLALACMSPELAAMPWSIYNPQYNVTQHVYLNCALPAPSGRGSVSLYVPTSYFHTRDFVEVESLHNRLAVGYYDGTGFQVDKAQLSKWQKMTAAALTSKEAIALRNVVEGKETA